MSGFKKIIKNKVILSLLITVAIITSLILASSPAQALTIQITNPASGTLGQPYTFTVQVNVEDTDLLPVHQVNLEIYNSNYSDFYTNLPLVQASSVAYTGTTSTALISATPGNNWGYGYGNRYGYGHRYGYGYGYYNFGYGYGYGYGYGSYMGTTSITYSITWTSPSRWPAGTYNIRALVYGNSSEAFTNGTAATFTLSAAGGGGGGGGGGGVIRSKPGTTSLLGLVDKNGKFLHNTIIQSANGKVTLNIPRNTIGKTKDGKPLSEITITPMDPAPTPPEGSNIIGLAYEFGPSGATFEPPITVTFTYDLADIPDGVNAEDLVIAFYDSATKTWFTLENIVVDPVTHTISGDLSHFTPFAVLTGFETEVSPAPTTTPKPTTTTAAAPTVQPTSTPEPIPTSAPTSTPKPTSTPTQTEAPAEPTTNWGLIGGLIAAAVVIVAGLLLYFLWWRKRTG